MLPVVVHFSGEVNKLVVFVTNPYAVYISKPCKHSLEVDNALGDWSRPARTVVAVHCPSGLLGAPE